MGSYLPILLYIFAVDVYATDVQPAIGTSEPDDTIELAVYIISIRELTGEFKLPLELWFRKC